MGKKKCLDCGKYDRFSKGLCLGCWKINHAKPIKKISEKHKKTISEYSVIRKSFLEKNPNCKAKLKGCGIKATEVHHIIPKRSKETWLDENNFLSVCRQCHDWIHQNNVEAQKLGLLKSKL